MRFDELPTWWPHTRTWGARMGKLQFLIVYDDGGGNLSEEDRWIGNSYFATYQDHTAPSPRTVHIEGLWKSFAEAERACEDVWRQLRRKQ